MKEIFMEALEKTEINEEAIFLIRERLFESQTSKNLKMMSGATFDKFYDIGSIMKLAEKIYRENPDQKSEEDLSKLILENCVMVRNISDFVDEEILFLLFSQGFYPLFVFVLMRTFSREGQKNQNFLL